VGTPSETIRQSHDVSPCLSLNPVGNKVPGGNFTPNVKLRSGAASEEGNVRFLLSLYSADEALGASRLEFRGHRPHPMSPSLDC
jgi:hypothetical protein